jgi:hypothetical protein
VFVAQGGDVGPADVDEPDGQPAEANAGISATATDRRFSRVLVAPLQAKLSS